MHLFLFFFIAKIRPSTFRQVCPLLSSIVCQVDLLLMTFTHHHSPKNEASVIKIACVNRLLKYYFSSDPNLKVAITHVRQACSQHSFGLPLRLNGLHRKKSDHFATRNMITRVLILYDVKRKQNTALELSEISSVSSPHPRRNERRGGCHCIGVKGFTSISPALPNLPHFFYSLIF